MTILHLAMAVWLPVFVGYRPTHLGHILELVSSTDFKSAEFVGEGDSSTTPEVYFSSLVETVVSVAPDARASTSRGP